MKKENFLRIIFLLLTLFIVGSFGSIRYLEERIDTVDYWYQRFAAYSISDSPFPGSDPPSVSYSFVFNTDSAPLSWNNSDSDMALGEVVLFHYTRRAYVGVGGFSLLEGRAFCCTPDLYANGYCDNINSLIINSDLNRDDLYYNRLNISSYVGTKGILNFGTVLEHTGVWYLFVVNCQRVRLGVTGELIWKNPYGYLPGQILGYLPLYWIVSVLYLLLCLAWGIRCIRFLHDMVLLQKFITVIVVLSVFDSLIWAGNYTTINREGYTTDTTKIFAALFSSFKLTLLRTLILLIALGLTITRLNIPRRARNFIIVLTCIYYVVEATNLYIDVALAAGREVIEDWRMFFFVLLIIGNFIYFLWIAYGIYTTVSQLRARDVQKIQMYKKLTILLCTCFATSVFIVIAELITEAADDSDKQFRASWLWQGYWELVYVACILFIAWVWRPNEDNKRFAYIDTHEDELPPRPPPDTDDHKGIHLDDVNEPKGETHPSCATNESDSDTSGFDTEPDDLNRNIPKEPQNKNEETNESTSSSDDD